MPVKVPPQLRLLGRTMFTSCSRMKSGPSYHSCRTLPVFCRILPFKYGFLGLSSPGNTVQFGLRRFSGRPFRPHRGSEKEVRASKSLIEDEDELSDWVGGLRTDSFRGRWTSEDEDMDIDRARNRAGSRDRERNVDAMKKKKRKRESDSYRSGERYNKQLGGDSGEENTVRKSRRATIEKGSLTSWRETRKVKTLDLKSEAKFVDEENDNNVVDMRESLRGGIGDLLSEESDHDDDGDELLRKKANAALGFDKEDVKESIPTSPREESDSYLSDIRFDQFSLSPLSLKGIKDAGYERMTLVQAATLPLILKGKDVLAKAKTGTGKTVAFLLPSIEVVANLPPVSPGVKIPPIYVLIVCPTRELANQAAAEANTLLKYHPTIGVQAIMGGTRLSLEQKNMQANPCQILVATPGRLRDHLENTKGLATMLMGVKVLVLDEADRLLSMGFRKDILKIIAAVPKERQTLLFSATVPEEVRQVGLEALKRNYENVDTVGKDEETNSQVKQMRVVAPLDIHFPLLYTLIKEHIADDVDYKIIVFCVTAKVTQMVAELLGLLGLNVREIHSRKAQSFRNKVSDEFRKSKGLILVTSDVSARGVDYPDVTLVIQLGMPSDREQYIHRLGRTGRKGKEGQGILLLAPWEEHFILKIKDLPVTNCPVPSIDTDTRRKVEWAFSLVKMSSKEGAYQSWLGFYTSHTGSGKAIVVQQANDFSRCMGLAMPPALQKKLIGKMGLAGVPGLRSK